MFDDRSPIYRQIAEQIREDLISGALADEEQVMSTNQYAAFHRINPATAAKAFQQLVDEGLLYKRRGVGMFVSTGARALLSRGRQEAFADRYISPLLIEARRLRLTTDDVVALIHDRSTTIDQPPKGDRP